MDIAAYTLKSQWDQLKFDFPSISLAKGKELLGCSTNEILRAEFNNKLTLITREVNFPKPLSYPIEFTNQYL